MNAKWLPVLAAMVVIGSLGGLSAQRDAADPPATTKPRGKAFELRDGDRVVLLGGTMIEREQRFGDWELLMTTQFPDRKITFRNLGWSGDTVWAESRGIFDPPAEGYRRMIEQVQGLNPTVIFLGYGANESFAGKAGLEKFLAQYRKLLNDLKPTGARLVFLGPPAHDAKAFPLPNQDQRDAELKLYNEAIRKLAEEYDAPIVDFLNAQNQIATIAASYADQPFTINGVHWNALGYRASAHVLGKSLGWELDTQSNIANAKRSNLEKLREAIIEKNRLYFHRWRPQNVTYLFGFRKHEQGQNAKEINQFDPLIEKQEAEIHRLKQPQSHRYDLRKVDR